MVWKVQRALGGGSNSLRSHEYLAACCTRGARSRRRWGWREGGGGGELICTEAYVHNVATAVHIDTPQGTTWTVFCIVQSMSKDCTPSKSLKQQREKSRELCEFGKRLEAF